MHNKLDTSPTGLYYNTYACISAESKILMIIRYYTPWLKNVTMYLSIVGEFVRVNKFQDLTLSSKREDLLLSYHL